MARVSQNAQWQKAVVLLCGVVLTAAGVGALYWAQIVFVPVALAVLFMFLLTPPVRWLERRGVGRGIAVGLVVSLTLAGVGEVMWVITRQMAALAQELPEYSANIRQKVVAVRSMSGRFAGFQKMIDDIAAPPPSNVPNAAAEGGGDQSTVIVRPESGWLTRWPTFVGSAAEFGAGLGLAVVLTIFGLAKREDLRNRFLRLVGNRRLAYTTKAVDEAGERVGRYLGTQAMVNIGYGSILAVAFGILGVKYALLWGFFAAVLRYVPYVGAWISITLPLAISVATTETWGQPVGVLAVFLALELTTYNLIEPLLFKRSMGVSETAQLVSAAFWGFLWGPVGLVLAAPLTVCLLVLGKYVPQLEFLDVLLGDDPALDPEVSLYQRLLAGDEDDATLLVAERTKATSAEAVFDDLLIPTLSFVKRDRIREDITEEDEEHILRSARDIVEDLGSAGLATPAASAANQVHVLACPAFDRTDSLALDMLQGLMSPERWEFHVVQGDSLVAEIVKRASTENVAVICIGSVPPGGLAHTRYLCKRLRSHLPNVKIVVGRWSPKANGENDQLLQAGADVVSTTLLATRNQLNAWLPVLTSDTTTRSEEQSETRRVPGGEVRPGEVGEALAIV